MLKTFFSVYIFNEENKDNEDENKEEEEESDSMKKIDIELVIHTVHQYEQELNLSSPETESTSAICYVYQNNGYIKKDMIDLCTRGKNNLVPFQYRTGGVQKGVFEPEYWPVMEDLPFEKANEMVGQMVFYTLKDFSPA